MPEINKDTPRRDMTVKGLVLSAPLPYAEGHTLEENEAAVMNQTWIENLRNNFASRIEEFFDSVGAWNSEEEKATRQLAPEELNALQKVFDEYIDGYEFGVRTGGRAPVDPVYAQALQLAEAQVKKAAKAKGISITGLGKEKIRSLCEEAIEKNPKFMQRAKEIVDARKAAVEDLSIEL